MNVTTRTPRPVLRRAAAVMATSALLVGVSSGIAAADETTPGALLLTQDEFPDGYWVMPAPAQRISTEIGDPAALFAAATVDPPECKNLLSAVQNIDEVGDGNLVVGINEQQRRSLSESLVARTVDVDTVKVGLLQTCSEVTVTTEDPRSGNINARVTTTEVSSDTQRAAFEIDIDGTRTRGGDTFPLRQKVLVGIASLNGYTVGVQGGTLGGDPDRGEFDDFFSSAVDKIADAE